MLKNFTKRILSRRKSFWLLLFFVLLTFLLRLPTLFRSFDLAYESQLAYFGREAFVGNGFYGSPWSMKGPGETFVYGLAYLVFGHSSWAFGVRIITTILAGLAAFTIYLIGKKLYMPLVGLFTAVFFALFFSLCANFAGTLSYA